MAADANGRRRDFFAGVQKQRLELQPLVYISFGGGEEEGVHVDDIQELLLYSIYDVAKLFK